MTKKTIVHIAQSAGGVAEYLYMFFKNFKDENYENVLIVSEDYKNQLERFKTYTSNIYIVPMVREVEAKKDIKSIIKVRKILKQIKPDIVYLHSSKAGAIGRIALAFNFKTKILYNAHGWYFNAQISDKKKKLFALIERILAIKTDKIINISKSEYDSALKYKIAPEKKMCIIENGIDFTKFQNNDKYREETRKKYDITENEIVIGVVGRLTEQKDPITMIKAFELVNKENKNTRLMYVGSGELEEEVKQFAKEHDILDKVIITGWVDNVEKYIPAFDIAVLPSKWEGFGLVLIEYMACNKPIIATNVGGIKDIIKNEENGLLFKKESEQQLCNVIEKYIKNEKFASKCIEKNKKYMKKYNIAVLINKTVNLIKN